MVEVDYRARFNPRDGLWHLRVLGFRGVMRPAEFKAMVGLFGQTRIKPGQTVDLKFEIGKKNIMIRGVTALSLAQIREYFEMAQDSQERFQIWADADPERYRLWLAANPEIGREP